MNTLLIFYLVSFLFANFASSTKLISTAQHKDAVGERPCPQTCHLRKQSAVQDCATLHDSCSVSQCSPGGGRPGFMCTKRAERRNVAPVSIRPASTCSLTTTLTFSGYKPGCECDDGSYSADLTRIIVLLFPDTRCLTECYLADQRSMNKCNEKAMTLVDLDVVTKRCCQGCGGYYNGFCRLEVPASTAAPLPRDDDCNHVISDSKNGLALKCDCAEGVREEERVAIVGGISRTCVRDCMVRTVDGDDVCDTDNELGYLQSVHRNLEKCCGSCGGMVGTVGMYTGCGRIV